MAMDAPTVDRYRHELRHAAGTGGVVLLRHEEWCDMLKEVEQACCPAFVDRNYIAAFPLHFLCRGVPVISLG